MNAIKRAGLAVALLSTITVYGQATSPAKQEPSGSVQFLNSVELAQVPGYSQAAVVSGGKMIFVSGQVGLNKAGEIVGKDDFRAQTTQAFANLRSILAAAGATPNNIVKLNFYVVGLNKQRLQVLRSVRDSYIDRLIHQRARWQESRHSSENTAWLRLKRWRSFRSRTIPSHLTGNP